MAVYYKERLLKDAMAPGYPEETAEKALGIWCALLSGTGKYGAIAPLLVCFS